MTRKNTVTRANALAAAIARFEANEPEREILEKMLAQVTKPRKKTDAPSKTRLDNERLAREVANAFIANGNEWQGSKWISEHVRGILTTQKAVAVCRVGMELGLINRYQEGKTVLFRAAE